jgi:hypothetical protein
VRLRRLTKYTFLGQRQIEINQDVTFDEDEAFRRSRESHMDEDREEQEAPREAVMEDSTPEEPIPEVQNEMVESERPVDPPREVAVNRKRPAWLRNTLQEVEGHATPKGSFRESKRPHKFSSYVALMSNIIDSEPSTFEEVAEKQEWKDAMMEEYQSIMKNDVWEVVLRPEGKSVVTSKWIYKIKHVADDNIEKYKARFVARGFSQREGEDYDETFSPVAKYTSIRSIIAIASAMGWKLHQMDVKTTFLNGVIEEEVYIEQPQGFVIHGKESHVCKLKKALYGLKQAPRAWYARIDGYLMSLGFTKSDVDPNLYYKVENGFPLILVLYVDDLFLTGDEKLIVGCKRELASEFEMKDLGLMHYFLGLEVWQRSDEIFLSQGKYIVEILQRFGMMDCKSMATPMMINLKLLSDSSSDLVDPTMYRQLIGSLMYLVNTRWTYVLQ